MLPHVLYSCDHILPPPPLVVLNGQLEVGERDGDEGGDDDEDDEDDEEDGVDGVDLVAPHRSKDVVQLDVDGAEGQEAGHGHLQAITRRRHAHYA